MDWLICHSQYYMDIRKIHNVHIKCHCCVFAIRRQYVFGLSVCISVCPLWMLSHKGVEISSPNFIKIMVTQKCTKCRQINCLAVKNYMHTQKYQQMMSYIHAMNESYILCMCVTGIWWGSGRVGVRLPAPSAPTPHPALPRGAPTSPPGHQDHPHPGAPDTHPLYLVPA